MRVPRTTAVPPGGYRFKDAPTGLTLSASTLKEATAKWVLLKKARGEAVGSNPEGEVLDLICARLPVAECQDATPPLGQRLGTAAKNILRFGSTMLDWALAGGLHPVTQDEAERRAALCAQCPENAPYADGCAGCHKRASDFLTKTEQAIRSKVLDANQFTTTKAADLHACSVCGCELKLMVHIPLDHLTRWDNGKMAYPSHCWKLHR